MLWWMYHISEFTNNSNANSSHEISKISTLSLTLPKITTIILLTMTTAPTSSSSASSTAVVGARRSLIPGQSFHLTKSVQFSIGTSSGKHQQQATEGSIGRLKRKSVRFPIHYCTSHTEDPITMNSDEFCGENFLQPSTVKRRKYMRRGSKCASMFMMLPSSCGIKIGDDSSSSDDSLDAPSDDILTKKMSVDHWRMPLAMVRVAPQLPKSPPPMLTKRHRDNTALSFITQALELTSCNTEEIEIRRHV
jgi:hypothetical protein